MPGSLRCTPANPKRHKNTAQENNQPKTTKTITGQKKKNSGSRTQVPSL